jgi:very-short-patch-repair endonuclease
MRYTKELFIQKSIEIHNNKYDYSLVDYKNTKTKVKIICPDHGIFEQIPKSHYNGHGCPYCANNVKMTTEQFIVKSNKVHNNKYDYSLSNYINAKSKVKIVCPEHGVFEQTANSHLFNHGCSKCYGNDTKTTEQFIKESKEIHGDKYDYSLVEYVNNKQKVKIICKKHGVFEQSPIKHIYKRGCPKCANEYTSLINSKTTEQFIKESKEIHDDKYDYSLVDYNGSFNKVKLICSVHGVFEQTPVSNLQGCGCKKCANDNISKLMLSSTKDFIEKSKLIHDDKYNYSLVDYVNAKSKVKIKCKEHGLFEQIPNVHLQGCGCPYCQISKGELKVKQFLSDNNFIYKEQHRFNDCKNILPLPFDFYLPDYNTCIEYDGEQHFRRFRFEKNDDKLIKRQKRDKIKTDFCRENNIKLIRIKYTEIKKVDIILNDCLIN